VTEIAIWIMNSRGLLARLDGDRPPTFPSVTGRSGFSAPSYRCLGRQPSYSSKSETVWYPTVSARRSPKLLSIPRYLQVTFLVTYFGDETGLRDSEGSNDSSWLRQKERQLDLSRLC
jgi:hypothetical protein